MGRIVRYAVATTLRQEEICKLEWPMVDLKKKLVVIRDRKDPRNKDGNDQKVPFLNLTGYDAWEIVLQQRIVTRGVEAQTIEAPSPCEGRPHHPTRQAVRWRSDNRRLLKIVDIVDSIARDRKLGSI